MNDNKIKSSSPLSDLQHQQLLLRMEYEYEKEEFRRQTETMGIARKVKRGLCWYPVGTGRSFYNSLNQLVIEIERKEEKTSNMYSNSDVRFAFSNRDMTEKYIISIPSVQSVMPTRSVW